MCVPQVFWEEAQAESEDTRNESMRPKVSQDLGLEHLANQYPVVSPTVNLVHE